MNSHCVFRVESNGTDVCRVLTENNQPQSCDLETGCDIYDELESAYQRGLKDGTRKPNVIEEDIIYA